MLVTSDKRQIGRRRYADSVFKIQKLMSQIAGIYAQDGLDIGKARDSFVRAGDWYKQEDANA
jgi:hypothetical protein